MIETLFCSQGAAKLCDLLQTVRLFLKPLTLPSKTTYQIELACEEALMNILSHSPSIPPLQIILQIEQTGKKTLFSCTIEDWAPPFNPLAHPPQPPPSSLEKQPIGGVGIHLIRRCVDEAHYERKKDSNLLILKKWIQV